MVMAKNDDTALVVAIGTAVASIFGNLSQAKSNTEFRRQGKQMAELLRRLGKAHATLKIQLASAHQELRKCREMVAVIDNELDKSRRSVESLIIENAKLTARLSALEAAGAGK